MGLSQLSHYATACTKFSDWPSSHVKVDNSQLVDTRMSDCTLIRDRLLSAKSGPSLTSNILARDEPSNTSCPGL
jgi:hypothetical protein